MNKIKYRVKNKEEVPEELHPREWLEEEIEKLNLSLQAYRNNYEQVSKQLKENNSFEGLIEILSLDLTLLLILLTYSITSLFLIHRIHIIPFIIIFLGMIGVTIYLYGRIKKHNKKFNVEQQN